MKETTAMQDLIKWMDDNSTHCTYGTIKGKAIELLKIEKQQIIQAWADGDDNGYGCYAEKYYLQKYE